MTKLDLTMRGGTAALAILIACCAVLSACGDDEETAADGGSDAGKNDAGATVDQCYAEARATDAGLNDETKCACEMCLQELTDCTADEGCLAIRACTERTGCRGINDCYLGAALCADVINEYGATSLSVTLSQQLGDCVTTMGCSVLPEPTCTTAAAFECDGNEDCPGQVCCGRFNGSGYNLSTCADSCVELAADGGTALWSQMCHPDEVCPNDGEMCTQSTYLPDYLFRCRGEGAAPVKTGSSAAGEVNCGDSVCGSGQKCCVRTPKAPYCTDKDEECDCDYVAVPGDDAGADDGGT